MTREVKYLQRRPIIYSRMPKDIHDQSVKTIGTPTDRVNRRVYNPFEPDSKEELLLLEHLGISPQDVDKRAKITKFWKELSVSVPAGNGPTDGYTFDLTKTPEGKYINFRHYLEYEAIKAHPNVVTYDDYTRGILDAIPMQIDMFILVDPKVRLKDELAVMELQDKALELYMNAKNDATLTIILLELMSSIHKQNIVEMEDGARRALLRKIAEDPNSVKQFIAIASDPDLKLKAKINRMVSVGTLTLHGNAYYNNQKKIGDDLQGAILFFKDQANQAEISFLNERYKRDKTERSTVFARPDKIEKPEVPPVAKESSESEEANEETSKEQKVSELPVQ